MYVERLLEFVSKQISESHHIEFYLSWSTKLLTTYASKENIFRQQSLISIQDSLLRKYEALSKVCDFNKYTLKVLIEMGEEAEPSQNQNDDTSDKDDDDDGDDDDDDDDDMDESNLLLIKGSNGAHDSDVEMPTDSDESFGEGSD